MIDTEKLSIPLPKVAFSQGKKVVNVSNFVNFDLLTGYLITISVVAYVLIYGFKDIGSFQFGHFYLAYLVIIIPIWIIDGIKSLFESFMPKEYKHSDEDLAKVEVIIACKDGEPFINDTLDDLKKRFKPEQIILVSNGSTDKTADIARHAGVKCLEYKQPIGKVRAINRGLRYVTKPYVLLLDDDTSVGTARIPTGLLDEGYEAVAFRVLVKESSWVTKFQAYEYRKSSDIGKRYHNKRASVQNISGAIGLFKCNSLINQIRRHNGEFSGEDLQRTLLIHLTANTKGVVLAKSTVKTEPPTTLRDLYKQRVFGWFPGLYSNFHNYLKIMTRDYMPAPLRFDAFYNCFLVMVLDVIRLLSLPILLFYPWYFITMYVIYVALEVTTYLHTDREEPFWIVLLYPLYGLFSFFTRLSAFGVLIYRRLTARFGKLTFTDDYRQASNATKLLAIIIVSLLVANILWANVLFNYSRYLIKF